jgi:hypothetical protein
MAGLAQRSKILSRILVENYGEMYLIIEVFLNGLNGRSLSFKSHIEDVGAPLGPQPDAIASAQFHAEDSN